MDMEGMEPLEGTPAAGPEGKRRFTREPMFLDPAAETFLLGRLNGISDVNVRVLGGDPIAGPEVIDFLRDAGFMVTSEVVERMVPPPLTRFALRYAGRSATLTVAPEVEG
ncbi:hypothetical protein V8J36_08335 [Frigidibacter sp. MR17.14]|uniref:hypothetical protein n=1 Tax=Frigidibacter sp. MR17.14 TaxID=3126509 RepID=UPI003012A2FC